MNDFIGYSETDIVRELGSRFRDYRQAIRLRQSDITFQSGVTVQTIRNFESGKATNITMVTFLKLLSAIGQRKNADTLLPELPDMNLYMQNPPQRVKKKKNER